MCVRCAEQLFCYLINLYFLFVCLFFGIGGERCSLYIRLKLCMPPLPLDWLAETMMWQNFPPLPTNDSVNFSRDTFFSFFKLSWTLSEL